jgi:hypothetical protein
MAWATKTTNGTKHTCEQSKRAFGKRYPGCPRCEELAQGSAPREGWQKAHFERKAQEPVGSKRPGNRIGIVHRVDAKS